MRDEDGWPRGSSAALAERAGAVTGRFETKLAGNAQKATVFLGLLVSAWSSKQRDEGQFPMTGAAHGRRLRCLCLHGSRQDSEIFQHRLEKLVKKMADVAVRHRLCL